MIDKTLIFGTSFVASEERLWLVRQWINVMRRLNPEAAKISIIDSGSPISIPADLGAEIIQLHENIGHLGSTGRDGWGRAFCYGMTMAREQGYSTVAYIDTDILFLRPVRPLFERMERAAVKVASVSGQPYEWIEGGILFAFVDWMNQVKFINKYDWINMRPGIFPEHRLEQIAGDDLFLFHLRGRRNDDGKVTVANAGGCDWLTHAPKDCYQAMLRAHGIAEV